MSFSMCAYGLTRRTEMYGIPEDAPRIQAKAKFAFAEFVRPDGYWPFPYSIEQAFQIYRWFVKTGKPFTQYQRYGAYDILIGRGVRGSTDLYYEAMRSLQDLQSRFHRVILGRSNGPLTDQWRAVHGIAYDKQKVVRFPHYVPFEGAPVQGRILSENQVQDLLKAYFVASGDLIVQLNPYHADAVQIVQTLVQVNTYPPFNFRFDLHYGVDGSSWQHTLASGDNFIDAFSAALTEFERISGQQLLGGSVERS